MRLATVLALVLATLPRIARAQGASEYQRPPHINADEIAIEFLQGRYIMPVTCKLKDDSQVEVDDSIQLKASPEAGGGKSLKATFFGIQVADADYCYSSVDRRVVDRRGFLHFHFRTRNRPDYGIADFRRMAKAGPLTYNAHRGELQVREIGADAAAQEPRVLAFDGGESRLVVEGIPDGTDGAKIVAQFFAKHPPQAGLTRRFFTFRFFAKDKSEFTFYAIEDDRRWK
jgi:hypothetical protein